METLRTELTLAFICLHLEVSLESLEELLL